MYARTNHITKQIATEDEMLAFGGRVAKAITNEGAVIFLYGPLGVGKTTFTRGFLRALGYSGKVKSPTYTLIESYHLRDKYIHHFDFYRLHDTRELEYIGLHEYFENNAICLVEWPEKGLSIMPDPNLSCYFSFAEKGRKIRIESYSEHSGDILGRLVSD